MECLQALHSWRLAKVSQQLVELVFEEQFLVAIPCTKFRPVTPKITVKRIYRASPLKRSKQIDSYPLFSVLVIRQAEAFARTLSTTSIKRVSLHYIACSIAHCNLCRQVLEAMSDFWTSCAQIRTQFVFLGIKYPIKLEVRQAADGSMTLRAVASMLFPKRATRMLVAFLFTPEVLGNWPFAIRELQCEVKAVYGTIEYAIHTYFC